MFTFIASLLSALVFSCALEADHREGVPERTQVGGKVVVPFETNHGKLAVHAMVNGRGPFVFLFDTGAGATVFNKDLADELGLAVTGDTEIGDPSNPRAIKAQKHKVDKITLGTAEFGGIEVVSFDRAALYRGGDAPRGVLGFPLFADCLLTLDYPHQQLVLENGKLPAADGKDVLDYRLIEGGISEIDIDVAGMKVPSHLDSGSMGGFALSPSFEKKLPLRDAPTVIGRGRTVNSDFEIKEATLDGAVKIGANVFEQPNVSFHPVIQSANVGGEILRAFAITFDQQNKRVRFAASGASKQAASTKQREGPGVERKVEIAPRTGRPRIGIMLINERENDRAKVEIKDVVPGSLADKAGLKPGDQIVKLNGKSATELDEKEMGRIMSEAAVLSFLVQRGAEQVEVKVAVIDEK